MKKPERNIRVIKNEDLKDFLANKKKTVGQFYNDKKWNAKNSGRPYKYWFKKALKALNDIEEGISKREEEKLKATEKWELENAAASSSEDEKVAEVESEVEDEQDKPYYIDIDVGDFVKYIDRTQPSHSRIQTSKIQEVRPLGEKQRHPLKLSS